MNEEYAEALAEVNEILKHSDSEVRKKIPYRFRKFLVQNANKECKISIDTTKKLSEQNIHSTAKDILALIYRDYLVDKEHREKLIEKELKLREEKEKKKAETYNYENLFRKKKNLQREDSKEILVVEKENKIIKFFKSLKDKILNFF